MNRWPRAIDCGPFHPPRVRGGGPPPKAVVEGAVGLTRRRRTPPPLRQRFALPPPRKRGGSSCSRPKAGLRPGREAGQAALPPAQPARSEGGLVGKGGCSMLVTR